MEERPTRRSSNSDEIWVLDFTPESAQEFRDSLIEQSKDNPHRPIIVYIDSYGGGVDALAKMIATMDEIPNPIITACMGKAMSCGAILLSHGDIRFCDPHGRIMIHRVSGVAYGDSDDMKADVVEVDRVNRYWLGFLAINSNLPGGYDELDKFMKAKDGKDRYLTAHDAKHFGLVDVIGRPKVVAATMYEVVNGNEKMPIVKRAKLRSAYAKEQTAVKKKTKKRGSK